MADPSKRRHPRVEIPLLVQYRFGAAEDAHIDYAINVSESGLFIETQSDAPQGSRVLVQITTRDGQFLSGDGQVVRLASGMAIELTGFSDEDRRILDKMVRRAIAEREARTPHRGVSRPATPEA